MAELRPNIAKRNLAAGKIVSVPMGPHNGDLIEHFGPLGFDAMWLEGEHGPVDFNNIPDLTRACDVAGLSSIVRVHQNEPAVIYRTFDLGAQGITVPHVNTKQEAEAVVDAAKFGPIGNRGSFTSRQGIGVSDYYQKANDETMVIILIEDIIAVNNLDEILEVDHIDVFFVAPGDLAQTMGYPGGAGKKEVVEVVENSIKKIVASGRTAGTLSGANSVARYKELGARFFAFSWTPWLAEGAKEFHKAVQSS